VTFNQVAATPTYWSASSIVAAVPAGATTGPVVVAVGGAASNGVLMTIVNGPSLSVAQVQPANGKAGVPLNARVVIRFTQPVQPAAIVAGTLTVSQGGTNIGGNVTLSSDGMSLTFAPLQNLAASTTFTVAVTNVAAGQSSPGFQSTFTTGTATDTVSPQVLQTSPQTGGTNVPTSAPIVVQFTKPMDPATLTPTLSAFDVTDNTSVQLIPGVIQVDATGTVASFVPQQPWGVGRQIRVSLGSAIQDSSGNALAGSGTSFSFTTAFGPDTVAPQLLGMSPSNGTSTVPLNAVIALGFSKPLNAVSVADNLQVQSGGGVVPGGIALSNGSQLITFTPQGGLSANTTYTVVIPSQITDVGGLALSNPATLSFATGSSTDTTTGSVISVNPANSSVAVPTNSEVQLQFSKAVDPLTVTSTTFYVGASYPNTSLVNVPGTVSVSPDGQTATFYPSATLADFLDYEVIAQGITDVEGQPISYFQSSFTTGMNTDTTPPTVTMISPPNGEAAVPVNTRVEVVVSAPLNPGSIGSNAITVSAEGTQVAGTVSLSSNRTILSFVPTSLLAVNTTYSVNVGGVTDEAGNLLLPFTASFMTSPSATANTTVPTVLSVVPTNGATAVSVGSTIILTFNEAIDLTSVSDTTVPVSVSGYGGSLAGTYSLDSSGTVLTFIPASPLPGNATITVQMYYNGVADLSGNLSGSFYSTFTTGTGGTTTGPTVVAVTPQNGATGIGPNATVTLTFSESLSSNTINANNVGLLINGTAPSNGTVISHSADNRVVTLNPYGLPASSTVSVLVSSGVTDLYGNPLSPFESQFTTGPALSTTAPYVISQRPGSGATGVPVNDSVVLYLSQPMNAVSVTGALHVAQNGVLVSGTTQVTDNGQVVQFVPSAPFQPNQVVQVFLDSTAQSTSGVNMNNYQSSFTTAPNSSTIAPAVIATNPAGGSSVPTNVTMDLAFNVPLDPTTLTDTTILCYQNGSWLQSAVSLVYGGTVIQVVPRFPLLPNTGVSCQVSTSLQGLNGVASQGGGVGFTTGNGPDTTIPTIVTLSPPNGSTNVGDNANIRLVFSKPINPLTVNASTIQLSGGGITVVPDSISFSNNNQLVLLVPHSPLPDNTQMTLAISGITDVAGNAVASQTTQFTTGAGPDMVGPILQWTSPLETNPNLPPTNVPLNAIIQLEVDKPIDPGTVNSNTFWVEDYTTGTTPLNGTYSVSADGRTITFVPAAPFSAGHRYIVYDLGGGIADLTGNPLTSAVSSIVGNFCFTTGTSTSTNAPQVIAVIPTNGATGIPINARAVTAFNEPIDMAKLGGITLTGPGGTVAVSQSLSNGNQSVTLIPVSALAPGVQYTLNVSGVQDISGNTMASPVTSTFITGSSADLLTPMVTSSIPTFNATGVSTTSALQVQFNKPIDPLTVTGAAFQVYPSQTYVPALGTTSFSPDNLTLTFTPSEPFDSLTTYIISLTSGITDLEGQGLAPRNIYFTTGQNTAMMAPVIESVSPYTYGSVGYPLLIGGLYFGTSQGTSTVTFNAQVATPTSWSDSQIAVPVPSGATSGPLVVTVNGVASNSVVFTVYNQPTITGISPASGPAGTVLTITGSNFGDSFDTTQVWFNSSVYPTPYITPSSWNETTISVTVPATALTGYVYVLVDGYQAAGPVFTVIPTPNISYLSTNSGVPGMPVSIYGTNFGATQGSSAVYFNGVSASVTGWNNGYIVAVAPSNVTTGPVTVVANSLTSNSDQIFTVTMPAIGSLSPPAAAPGATITITGSGLTDYGLTTQVLFNSTAGSVSNSSSTSLTVAVPGNATSGPVTVVLGSVSSNSVNFTVEQPPAIASVSPNSGPFVNGTLTPITITGSGFGATQSNSTVNFFGSSTAPEIISWSDSSITLWVADDAATGPLTVQVGGLSAVSPSFFYRNWGTKLTDSLGNQSQYSFVSSGGSWIASSQGPGCVTCTLRGNITNIPDAKGNILTTTDDLNNTTTYTYDSANDMTSASKPLNANTTQTTSYTYNSFGEVLTMTDPLGNVTTNTYDPNGNLLTVTTPQPNGNTAASVTQFQYAPNGELTQITDPRSNVTKLTYTPAGLIASITDAQQNTTSYQYDARGNRTAVIDPINGAAHPTSFAYDIMNRLTGITYPDGSTAGFTYDVRGRRTSATDQNNRTTYYTYDDADRLTAVTDPANNITQYAYDTEDNLLAITDANNNTTQFAYNARGWVTQTTFPSSLAESYTYDAVGNLLSKTDRKNQTIQYVYDALYRLTSKSYPDQTAVEYAYDLAGKVLQVADPTGSYGFAYDNMGRLIGTSTQYAFLPGLNFQNSYSYDAASNRTSLTAPDGSITTYGYDTLNRLNGLANSWAGSFGFGYDALSRRTSLTRPNGVNTSYTYDALSHLLSVLHQAGLTVLDGASYTYDPVGNRTSKTNYLDGVTSNYSYDPIYELTQVTQGGTTTESYSYDAVGNRLSTINGGGWTYNNSNELTGVPAGSFTPNVRKPAREARTATPAISIPQFRYDANGNTLTDAQYRAFTWDYENRLTQVVNPDGETTTFAYDPFGRRIQKSGPLGTTSYLYDGPNVFEAVDQSASVVARYTQELRIDQPIAQLSASTAGYYHADGLGSITSLSSSAGALVETYSYDSFGSPLTSTGTIANPFRYTGRELDSETGIYYYRARFYDPSTGRFASEDPAEFLGGMNFYAYVGNHASNLVDPSGLQAGLPGGIPVNVVINLVNWWNPPPPQPLYFPPPPAPPLPLRCQFAAQCDFTPDMDTGLHHFQDCLMRVPTITCGRGGHDPNDPHSRGEGADYGTNHNPWMTRDVVIPCFTRSFPNSYCQEEYNAGSSGATHWHLQFNPSRRGNIGCSPYIHAHGQ
jgi:RHS repeat-associated protein